MIMALASHVMPPGIQRTIAQVIQIALIGIGLPFKRDIAIGISTHGQAHQPFNEIGQEKEDKEHLALLGRVYAFVVHHLVAQVNPRMHKQHSQQIDGSKSPEW